VLLAGTVGSWAIPIAASRATAAMGKLISSIKVAIAIQKNRHLREDGKNRRKKKLPIKARNQ
jgi:hypothetical protein